MSSSNIPKHFFSLFATIMIIIQLVYVNPKSTIEFKNQDEKE